MWFQCQQTAARSTVQVSPTCSQLCLNVENFFNSSSVTSFNSSGRFASRKRFVATFKLVWILLIFKIKCLSLFCYQVESLLVARAILPIHFFVAWSVCHIRAACLNHSTDSDAIWQVHFWCPMTHVSRGSLTPRGKGDLGSYPWLKRAVTNCSQTVSPMLPSGVYKQRVGWICQSTLVLVIIVIIITVISTDDKSLCCTCVCLSVCLLWADNSWTTGNGKASAMWASFAVQRRSEG